MLRAAVAAAMLATAYCGAKGPPQPPAREAPDGGVQPAARESTSTSTPGSEPPATHSDAGPQ